VLILCDESVPLAVERALIIADHDVEAVRIIMQGSSDQKVLEAAVRGERVLLTFDRDFGELVFRALTRPAPTTVYVRAGLSANEHARQVIQAMDHVEQGFFLVVYRDKIRKRPIH
jgi:predicted nuclease of predicted toxin-antitoxin system